ncbi:porin family protein [Sediminitomix flava]|uniref:Outer membrane protein with beta-barrel domain n=1 Tax=Sediminitomix flava TaxID=379075 RepID=A0A315Z969_SEDFL|nr:outer membrane beta-barrel protein [Sediminitomix flava]PWJ40764.1 hypothetical protein BC781_10422 [Sediminitomix flava]
MNTAKDNFGKIWKEACENAKLPPDESLWNLVLDRLSNSKWQKALEEGKIPPNQELWKEITHQLEAIKWQKTVEEADLKPKKDLWDSISDELDASEWSEKLEGENKIPKKDLWTSISNELDASEWSEKFEDEQLQPKDGMWAAISDDLETSEWSEKLENEELQPDSSLWNKIESELPQESKSKVVVFPWWKSMAAAVTLIAVGTIGVRSLTGDKIEPAISTQEVVKENHHHQIVEPMSAPIIEEKALESAIKENEYVKVASAKPLNTVNTPVASQKARQAFTQNNDAEPPIFTDSNDILAQASSNPQENTLAVNKVEKANLREIVLYKRYSLQSSEAAQVNANAYYSALDRLEKVNEENKDGKFYAGLNLNSTAFDSKLTGGNSSVVMATSNMPETSAYGTPMLTEVNQSTKPAISMRYGLEAGMHLSKKWVVETGLIYGNLGTTGTSEAVSTFRASSEGAEQFSVTNTTSYDYVYNSFSVPLKVGYVIGNKKLRMIVKSGINTEIISGNELKVNSLTYQNGAPELKPYYFNGVIGNEINYRFDQRFNIGIEANYEFGFDRITESNFDSYGNPNAYNFGVKLKYLIH